MPSRRAYLATLAAVGLAGCVGDSPGSATESPTDTDSPTATTAPGTSSPPELIVEAAAVQYAYRHIENVDWNGVQPADGQFVFVTVDARPMASPPSRGAFSLVAGGEQYDAIELAHSMPVDLKLSGNAYAPDGERDEPRGWLVFETPAELDAAPTLRLERDPEPAAWELDADLATAPPPEWEWAVDAPEAVAPDGTFEIAVTAENVGDGPGSFRGAVNFSYPFYSPAGFDIALDPGQSGTESVEASTEGAEPGREIDYGIRTPIGEGSVSVTVEAESSGGNETA